MRISDWSSDVCSSDLHAGKNEPILRRLRECFGRIITISVEVGMNLVVFPLRDERDRFDREKLREAAMILQREYPLPLAGMAEKLLWVSAIRKHRPKRSMLQIGRSSCRERVCLYVSMPMVPV